MSSLFEFDHVGFTDGATVVLHDVNVSLPDGGVTVIGGPSGSGKSTLLRLCNRLLIPTSGVVRFRGTPLGDLDTVEHRRCVGMVFQRPTVFDGTCYDNLRAAIPRTADLTESAAASHLDRVGLDPALLDRDARVLSGGEAQRLCLARTLATGCSVLLADEPTSALDPDAGEVLERLVVDLVADGVSVVWVTHDAAQCDRLADHRVTVEAGRVYG